MVTMGGTTLNSQGSRGSASIRTSANTNADVTGGSDDGTEQSTNNVAGKSIVGTEGTPTQSARSLSTKNLIKNV